STARDFARLDAHRLESYRSAGVSSELLDDLHAQARTGLEEAESALRADAGDLFHVASEGAWSTETLVYQAAQDMADDVVLAAVFLLLLCVPFAFCMERLLVGTPNVYRQILGAITIFALMTLALYAFHPAFRISSSALIIILAFAILLMSGVVIWVIYGRFDSELKKVRSGRGVASEDAAGGQSFARASVLGQAVMLGIANMRRRKFRTLLTSTTVVLITFSVLCFTSSTTFTSIRTVPTGETSSYPGIMLRQRGFRVMPQDLAQSVEVLAQLRLAERQGGEVMAHPLVVHRRWNLDNGDENFTIYLEAADENGVRRVGQRGAVGFGPGETRVSSLAEVVGRDAAVALESETDHAIALSTPIAETLGVDTGDTIYTGGVAANVVAVYDPALYDRVMRSLSGSPVAPLSIGNAAVDAGGRRLIFYDDNTLGLDGDSAATEAGANYEHLSSSEFFLCSDALSKRLPHSNVRTTSIRLADNAAVERAAELITPRYALATFAGFDDGVALVTASSPTSVAGAAVAVPLAIGGLIIFNTLMGSIAERRREIHVYTSLGLAPSHVGALFVAEALTYGLIGAVFGYVVGQLVGTVLVHLDWLGGATLNYSGTSAMLTMGLVLVVVLLSALVPARLASKIAAPSVERSWTVPAPQDGVIRARLPFTINKTAAAGAIAYLHEWMDAHADGTIGKFSSGDLEPFHEGETTGLRSSVWLTPFDLGVKQACVIRVMPGEIDDVYEVDVELTRQAG
ncbi:MAG: ABC transporter permease, partial [Planctomycetota bacterium]